eukprot:scaffold118490_cov73-Cyclotella_meneghiniana.AAC.5
MFELKGKYGKMEFEPKRTGFSVQCSWFSGLTFSQSRKTELERVERTTRTPSACEASAKDSAD